NTPPPRRAPITASSHDTAPVPRLASTPATIPGSVIAFGMIWSWRSMAVIAMSAARRAAATTKRAVGPNTVYADRNAAPVTASTSGYRQEIGIAQARQRPRRSAKDRSGRLSYHAIGAPQPRHAEAGRQRLRRSGRRTITTFRKLPIMRPKRQTAASATAGAPSAMARSFTSPRREQHGPDLLRHLGAEHAEDPVRGARGVGPARLEKNSDQPIPGVGIVELQLDRVSELLAGLVSPVEIGEHVPEIGVREDMRGLELEGALDRHEGFRGPVHTQERRGEIVERVDVVRVARQIALVRLDGRGEIPGHRVDEPHVVVGLRQVRPKGPRPLEMLSGEIIQPPADELDPEISMTCDTAGFAVDGESPERVRVMPDLNLVEGQNREPAEPRDAGHADCARDDGPEPSGSRLACRDSREPAEHQ